MSEGAEEMRTPPGWHIQNDGRERYWDGQQWTDEFREAAARPGPASSSGNMRIWLVVGAVGLAVLILSLLSGNMAYAIFGIAPLVVGIGGALWETATRSDAKRS